MRGLKALPKTWFCKIQQMAIRGTPDILACIAGHFVALELKASATGTIDKLQVYNLAKISDCGGAAFLVHPGNWDQILDHLCDLAGVTKGDKSCLN